MNDLDREHALATIAQRLWLALCTDPESERPAFETLGIKPVRSISFPRLLGEVRAAARRVGLDAVRKV